MQNFPYQQPLPPVPPANSKNHSFLINGIFSLVFGLLAFNSLSSIFPESNELTKSVEGKITALQSEDSENPIPVFTFSTSEGREYSLPHDPWYPEFDYNVDQPVTVYYQPDAPEKAWILPHESAAIFVLLFQIISGYWIFFGAVTIFMKIKNVPDHIIGILTGGLNGLSWGIPALVTFPVVQTYLESKPAWIPAEFFTEFSSVIPWVLSSISFVGFLIVVITIVTVRNALMKYVPPTV
ncbi:MAG: DUF3592 domain-containing protein [Candidatus Altimarinota bacterium]